MPTTGPPFAGHLVAGGAVHRFRNSGRGRDGVKPLGICHHPGIALHFAWPGNAQAKVAERTFASLSRVMDDRPEFVGAHAGHAAGAAPHRRVKPVPLALAQQVIDREVARYNPGRGRRGQRMRGRSCREVPDEGLAARIRRQPTQWQLSMASLICTAVCVDRFGRVAKDNWTYGGPDTQDALLGHHTRGPILPGRDPADFNAPASLARRLNLPPDATIEDVVAALSTALAAPDPRRFVPAEAVQDMVRGRQRKTGNPR